MDTLKTKEGYVIQLSDNEMDTLMSVISNASHSLENNVLRKFAEYFRTNTWAWNKLGVGRFLDKKTASWSKYSEILNLTLIDLIINSNRNIKPKCSKCLKHHTKEGLMSGKDVSECSKQLNPETCKSFYSRKRYKLEKEEKYNEMIKNARESNKRI